MSGGSSRLVTAAADAVLAQKELLLASLSALEYVTPCALAGASIGQHMRHSLDHLAKATDAAPRPGDAAPALIDYDRRERATAIERDLGAARALVARLRADVGALPPAALDAPVNARFMLLREEGGADAHGVLGSTLRRELAFATHHAIHHNATIALIAKQRGLALPASFGVAPSTAAHAAAEGAGGG